MKAVVEELCRYFRDLLETDFKRRLPKRMLVEPLFRSKDDFLDEHVLVPFRTDRPNYESSSADGTAATGPGDTCLTWLRPEYIEARIDPDAINAYPSNYHRACALHRILLCTERSWHDSIHLLQS